MSNKEILHGYALKALERFESKKINVFENGIVESLDESGRFVDTDHSKVKDYKKWVLNSIEEGNGIFIIMGQFVIEYCGSFEDASDEDFVFDDSYYEEGYLDKIYREYYGFDDEDMYDEPIDEEDYDFEDEPEAISFYIDAEPGVSAVCSVDYFPQITDFICHVGINVFKENDKCYITPGYAYLPDVGAFDPRMTYEDWPITKESIEDDPIAQLFAVVLDSNLTYEGEEDEEYNEWGLESLLEKIRVSNAVDEDDIKIKSHGNKFEKEAEELLKSGEISNYLEHFEKINTTTDSIYDLGDYEVLIILKDGTNLTNWEKVEDKSDILYIREDFSNYNHSPRKYIYSTNLKAAVITGVTNKIEDMESMFGSCTSLTELSGLETWDTSNISKMEYMFSNCASLTDLSGLENWDISKANKLWDMFYGCSSLEDISPLANWDTSQVTSMASMFNGCFSLSDLSPLANWDTSQVKNMSAMFGGCFSLSDLSPLANWDTSQVKDMKGMFSNCTSLADLSPLSRWDTSQVSSLVNLFYNCSVVSLNGLEKWDTSTVENMQGTFRDCSSLVDISSLANWDTSKVNNMRELFGGCSSLSNLSSIDNWNVSTVENIRKAFDDCPNIEVYPSWYEG